VLLAALHHLLVSLAGLATAPVVTSFSWMGLRFTCELERVDTICLGPASRGPLRRMVAATSIRIPRMPARAALVRTIILARCVLLNVTNAGSSTRGLASACCRHPRSAGALAHRKLPVPVRGVAGAPSRSRRCGVSGGISSVAPERSAQPL